MVGQRDPRVWGITEMKHRFTINSAHIHYPNPKRKKKKSRNKTKIKRNEKNRKKIIYNETSALPKSTKLDEKRLEAATLLLRSSYLYAQVLGLKTR